MSRLIYCAKLKAEKEGLKSPPYPGPIGQRLYKEISQEAWELWLKRQTMFINEGGLNLTEPSARAELQEKMLKFLFEDEDEKPAGFVEPE